MRAFVFSGGTKRESFHGHVFNFKLARFVTNREKYLVGKQPILELKTWPRVWPVGQNLSAQMKLIRKNFFLVFKRIYLSSADGTFGLQNSVTTAEKLYINQCTEKEMNKCRCLKEGNFSSPYHSYFSAIVCILYSLWKRVHSLPHTCLFLCRCAAIFP